MKNPDPKDPALDCPLRGLPYSFPLAAVSWSDGALQNFKVQAPNLRVSGVGCNSVTRFQVSVFSIDAGRGAAGQIKEKTDERRTSNVEHRTSNESCLIED